MGSQRRMFSRRSVIGLVLGILLGFNLANWLANPVPNRTDIAIELIARGGGDELSELRLGAAHVRHGNRIRMIKSGKNCNEEDPNYGKSNQQPQEPKENNVDRRANDNKVEVPIERKHFDEDEDDAKTFDDFDLEEERDQIDMEQENGYEFDMAAPEQQQQQGQISQQDRLEDFRPVPKAMKYNYDSYPKEDSEKERSLGELVVKKAKDNNPPIKDQETPRQVKDRNHFMYVGVLTAQKYLETRGRSIMQTWGPKVPGKVEFYVGEGVKNVADEGVPLPLVRLPSVRDDVYPPQKKSFMLLKHMYDFYLNSGYQWFIRADDDIYIKTDQLRKFLRRLNSSEPIFLGQTGLGNAEERGRLSLNHGENYCMGGPGMIFSREVLRRVGPHIRDCVKHLYSWHEDVELSRCVRRFANVNCAWSYQMQELFYEHYYLRRGYIDPSVDLSNPKLYSAMTLHPNKNPAYQVKLHSFMEGQKISARMTRIKLLQRDILKAKGMLGRSPTIEEYKLGLHPTLHRFVPKDRDEVIAWDFINERLLYEAPPSQARRAMPTHRIITLRNIIMQVMQMMNSNARTRGRVIDFKQIAYGYRRVNPIYGAEYILDLLLIYKRYKGKKMTIPVRRHAYLQQTFTRTQFWEDSAINVSTIEQMVAQSRKGIVDKVLSSVLDRSRNVFKIFGFSKAKVPNSQVAVDPNVKSEARRKIRYDSGRLTSYSENADNQVAAVNIIVPLVGRIDTFRKFMSNLASVSLSRGDPVSLLVVLFKQIDPELEQQSKTTIEILKNYSERYPLYDLRYIEIGGKFSRGMALEIGASHFSNDSLLFFCDVDVVFSTEFTRKCRANSILGKSVYYPILYSEYHPEFSTAYELWKTSKSNQTALYALQDEFAIRKAQADMMHFNITDTGGYWRNYGYGLLCVHQSDFIKSGGFNINIKGWGLEDVDLIDKFVSAAKRTVAPAGPNVESAQKKSLAIVRTPDPSLVHVYHPSQCSVELADNQLRMCRASRASGITCVGNLAIAWQSSGPRGTMKHPKIIHDPVSDIVPLELETLTKLDRKTAETEVASDMLHVERDKRHVLRAGRPVKTLRLKQVASVVAKRKR